MALSLKATPVEKCRGRFKKKKKKHILSQEVCVVLGDIFETFAVSFVLSCWLIKFLSLCSENREKSRQLL